MAPAKLTCSDSRARFRSVCLVFEVTLNGSGVRVACKPSSCIKRRRGGHGDRGDRGDYLKKALGQQQHAKCIRGADLEGTLFPVLSVLSANSVASLNATLR